MTNVTELQDWQQIAYWLDQLHCPNSRCLNSDCLKYHKIASMIRTGEYKKT